MSLFEMYRIGGPYMNLISLMALLMVVVAIWKSIQIFGKNEINPKLLDLILMAGSIAVALGLMSQIIGFTEALAAIREAGDISPSLVMSGAIISFYAPIWGFIVFIFSMVFYFVLKEIIKARQTE